VVQDHTKLFILVETERSYATSYK